MVYSPFHFYSFLYSVIVCSFLLCPFIFRLTPIICLHYLYVLCFCKIYYLSINNSSYIKFCFQVYYNNSVFEKNSFLAHTSLKVEHLTTVSWTFQLKIKDFLYTFGFDFCVWLSSLHYNSARGCTQLRRFTPSFTATTYFKIRFHFHEYQPIAFNRQFLSHSRNCMPLL